MKVRMGIFGELIGDSLLSTSTDENYDLMQLFLGKVAKSWNYYKKHFLLGQYAVNDQLRLQTLNMYFGAAQNSTTVPATRECG